MLNYIFKIYFLPILTFMAAYTAVISLLQTLQLFDVQNSQPFDSLYATAQYFQHALESNSGFDSEKIKSLEEKIRDAATEAEDVVELKISQFIKASGWRFGTFQFQHQDLLPVVEKMDKIKNQVMEIVSHDAHDQVLELSRDSSIGTTSASYPTLEDDIVRGLDDDLEIIVERLKGFPRDLDVVTISGMGGIGKTTLARKAYHHQRIRYHFDVLAWVTISQEFRFRNVLLELLHCISKKTDTVNSTDYDKMDESELAEVVQKSLNYDEIELADVVHNHLKPCFLSMCSFPEDFQVDTRRLIQLWIAEGFIRTSENGKSLEEVAEHYLEDLISRNLIQARKRRFNGEIKECKIHDLLHEFCLIEAEMTKHMHVQKTHPILPTQKHNFRRFSFQTESYSVDDCCKLLPHVARSIHLFFLLDLPFKTHINLVDILPIYRRDPVIHEFFCHFNLLRVLAIFNRCVQFDSFSLVITKLFHLRYLRIEFYGDIPESISDLQNLQTLICHGYCSLPGKIWTMKNLRFIHTKGPSYLPSPRTEHPMTRMPNLEEFSILCYTSCTNEVFCVIPNLKRLIIHLPLVLDEPSPQIFDMSRLTKLEALKLSGQMFDMSRLTKLEALKLSGSVRTVEPIKRFVFPTSLRRLSIKWCCYFDWADISSTVMMLPNLEELKLKSCVANDVVWRMSDKDKFESLKLFLLDDVELGCWEASSDNFPNLKRLIMKRCNQLQEIPADFGEICTSESIELHDCGTTAEESARKIEQEQVDLGNNTLKIYIHKVIVSSKYSTWEDPLRSYTM